MKFNYDIEPLPEGFMEFFDKKITEQNQMKGVKLEEARSLGQIVGEIRRDWKNVNYAAKPYLDAMSQLNSIKDKYYADSGESVVRYFLANASSWKGETAKRIKAELKDMLKEEVELAEGMTVAFDKNGKLVGLYRDLETAKKLKPNHTYKPYDKNKEYGVDTERELAKFEEEYQLPRQFKDPKTEMEIVKNDKVIVIDKKDWAKYKKDGWMLAEMYGDLPLKTKGADLTEGMSDDDIRDYYDSHPNLTLQQLAAKTGKSVAELKKILMNEGVDLTPDTEEEDDDEMKEETNLSEGKITGKDRDILDRLIDKIYEVTAPDYEGNEDENKYLKQIASEFDKNIAKQVEDGIIKMHLPRTGHTGGYDTLDQKRKSGRITKLGKLNKQDLKARKNEIIDNLKFGNKLNPKRLPEEDEKKSLKTLELESKETKNMTSLVEAIRAVVTGKTLTEAEDKNPDFDKERKGKLDPVDPKQTDDDFEDREDKDIDNDGDSDSSDEYLHKRRAAIAKALDKKG